MAETLKSRGLCQSIMCKACIGPKQKLNLGKNAPIANDKHKIKIFSSEQDANIKKEEFTTIDKNSTIVENNQDNSAIQLHDSRFKMIDDSPVTDK